MDKIKISAVNYTNSKAFIYGIKNSAIINKIELSEDFPSACAAKLINNQVDIGLVPVAVFPLVENANIIADYCIGSDGAVNSVFIFSDLPIHEIKTLRLDAQSRTSNNLAKVLLKFYWKKDVQFISNEDEQSADAIVLIGDRTFGKTADYPNFYDLGQIWKDFTGLPFMYAAWIANKTISDDFKAEFNEALKFGLENRAVIVNEMPTIENFDMVNYLYEKLEYNITEDRLKAMKLFLDYVSQL